MDIAQGVDGEKIGAGDQGMMFGYASDETAEYMPVALMLAHKMAKKIELLRTSDELPYLKPDGKTQVTVEYDSDGYVQLSYAIGIEHPVSVSVDTFGTGNISDIKLSEIVVKLFDLSPSGIITTLDLKKPIYRQTSVYGHFGRNDLDLPWERLDMVDKLKQIVKEAKAM